MDASRTYARGRTPEHPFLVVREDRLAYRLAKKHGLAKRARKDASPGSAGWCFCIDMKARIVRVAHCSQVPGDSGWSYMEGPLSLLKILGKVAF